MFTVFAIMIAGMIVGYFLRRIPQIPFLGKLITCFIFLLLFFLGTSVGSNENIVNNLSTIGLQALIITMGGVTGSVLIACFLYHRFFKEKNER